MLKELTSEQRALADYMSELSEEAYCAGWMTDLEFDLWECLTTNRNTYSRLTVTDIHRTRLRQLSDACGGWIVFDDKNGESFIPLPEWIKIYDDKKS